MKKGIEFINIQDWMLNPIEDNGLNLKGNDLLIYAIIFGFSQDGESTFNTGITGIKDTLYISRPTIIASLKKLVKLGYIEKVKLTVNRVTFYNYRVILRGVKHVNSVKVDGVKHVNDGVKHVNPILKKKNNKVFLKENIKRKKFKRTTKPKSSIPEFYNEYSFFTSEFSSIWFNDFLPMKKKKGGNLKEQYLIMNLNNIQKYSKGDKDIAMQMLLKTVNNGWKDFFELNPKQNNSYSKPKGLRSGISGNIDYTSGVKTIINEW